MFMDYVNQTSNSLLRSYHLNPVQKRVLAKRGAWATFFRENILFNLPMDKISDLYCNDNGRPTKELRALTGAIILQHLFNLSDNETCEQYTVNNCWIEALALDTLTVENWSVCPKTLWNLTNKLVKSGLYKDILETVTVQMAKSNHVTLKTQRLDSVHVFSNMAILSRMQLFHSTTKTFLRNLKKSHKEEWSKVSAEIRDRYLSDDEHKGGSSTNFFGQAKADDRKKTVDVMADDILKLLEMFNDNESVKEMVTFQLLQRLFAEQCEVVSEDGPDGQRVRVRDPKEISPKSLQNPFDPDATYSAHKGKGYKVQLMETCGETKDDGGGPAVNLITFVKVEGADVHDGKALLSAIDESERLGLKPEAILCDTAYGGDDNVLAANKAGVEIVSPVGGSDPEVDKIRLAEFAEGGDGLVESCPKGQKCLSRKTTKKGNVVCSFDAKVCGGCPAADKCIVKISNEKVKLHYTPKDMRLSKRRASEKTAQFKKRYAMRAGIEATNSRLDRETGFKRLRYRGIAKIRLSVTFKVLGVNCRRIMAKKRA
jgi:hypothetical protein